MRVQLLLLCSALGVFGAKHDRRHHPAGHGRLVERQTLTSCPTALTYVTASDGQLYSVCTGINFYLALATQYTNVASAQACASACQATTNCALAAYYPASKVCWAKSNLVDLPTNYIPPFYAVDSSCISIKKIPVGTGPISTTSTTTAVQSSTTSVSTTSAVGAQNTNICASNAPPSRIITTGNGMQFGVCLNTDFRLGDITTGGVASMTSVDLLAEECSKRANCLASTLQKAFNAGWPKNVLNPATADTGVDAVFKILNPIVTTTTTSPITSSVSRTSSSASLSSSSASLSSSSALPSSSSALLSSSSALLSSSSASPFSSSASPSSSSASRTASSIFSTTSSVSTTSPILVLPFTTSILVLPSTTSILVLPSTTSILVLSSTTSVLPTTTSSRAAASSSAALVDGTCFVDNQNGRLLGSISTNSADMTNAVCQTYCNTRGYAYSGTEYSTECYCSNIAPTAALSTACNMPCGAKGSTDMCGGPNAVSVRYNAATAVQAAKQAAVVASYTNQGCYKDNYPAYVLTGASTSSPSMTVEMCLSYCTDKNFNLAGLENGGECYCGNSIVTDGSTFGVGNSAGCSFTCPGNNGQICGGNNVLNLYSRNGPVSTISQYPASSSTTTAATSAATPSSSAALVLLPATVGASKLFGCYLDSNTRTLTTQLADVPSVEACIAACTAIGSKYAGLEYYGQCFCGNELVNNGPTVIDAQKCNFACNGNSAQTCGGSWAVQVYSLATSAPSSTPSLSISKGSQGYTYVDSYADSTSARVLSGTQQMSATTVESCIASCSSAGFPLAGLEYGSECWCGQALLNNPAGGQVPTMACQGASAQLCGGPNVVQVYRGVPSTVKYLAAPVTNGACVTDNVNGARTLSEASFAQSNMTPQVCKTLCQNYTYYGVEYSAECFCGNSFPSQIPFSTACNMPCSGLAGTTCGGPNALNIYSQ